jgi:hypothetical protein
MKRLLIHNKIRIIAHFACHQRNIGRSLRILCVWLSTSGHENLHKSLFESDFLKDSDYNTQEQRNSRSSSTRRGCVCHLCLIESLCNPCSYKTDVSDKDRYPGQYAKDRD